MNLPHDTTGTPECNTLLPSNPIESPEFRITDLIPADQFQAMLKRFSLANGVMCVIHDRNGNPVVRQGEIRGLCSRPQYDDEDNCIAECGIIHRQPVACRYDRLSEVTEPIYIDGHHVADWTIGMCGFGGVIGPFVEESCGSIEQYNEFYDRMSAQVKAHFAGVCDLLKLAVADAANLGYSNLCLMQERIKRRENEDRIERGKGILNSIFDNSTDGILLVGKGGIVSDSGRGYEQILGVSREEIIEKDIRDTVCTMLAPEEYTPEEIEQEYLRMTEILTQAEQATVSQTLVNRKTRRKHIIQSLYFPVRYSGTEMMGAISRDITDSVEREHELTLEKDRLRSLGDNFPGGCLFRATIDPDTHAVRMLYLSKTWEIISGGIPVEDAVADMNVIYDVVLPDDLPDLVEEIQRSARTMTNTNATVRFNFAGQEQKWAHISSHPHMVGRRLIWDGFILDISERKRAELKLEAYTDNLELLVRERTEEMEAANEELYATNEELYATNEEFAVTNDELQLKNDLLNQEIAARMEAMQKMEDSESKMRNFITQSFEGIVIIDDEGRIVEWNPEQERITEVPRHRAVGQYAWDVYRWLMPQDKADEAAERYRQEQVLLFLQPANDVKTGESEHIFCKPDGVRRNISIASFRIKLTDTFYVGQIVHDTTERKQMDEELERYRTQLEEMVASQTRELIESKERLTSLSDNLPGGAIFQMTGNVEHQLQFTYISARFEEIFHLPVADAIADSNLFFNLCHLDDREKLRRAFSDESRSDVADVEFRVDAGRGETGWMHLSSARRLNDDGSLVWDGFITDITDRKNAEHELDETRRRQAILIKVLQTVQAIGNLSGAINTALSEIGEYAGVSRSYIFEKSPDGQTADNVYEWCGQGVAPEIDNLQGVPVEYMSDWFDSFENDEYICASDIRDLSPIVVEKLQPQGIKSILVLPLKTDGVVYGFVGFDECAQYRTWQQKEVELLISLSQIISTTTTRFRAQKAMQLSQQTMRTVLDNVGAAIYVATFDSYKLLFANKKVKDMMGSDIEGKTCWQVMQKDMTGPCSFCPKQKLLDSNRKPTETYRWEFCNSNTGRWFECSDAAIEWVDGRLVHMEYATDITDRRNAEEALRQSEELYRQLTVASPDAIVVCNPLGKIVYASPKAKELFLVDDRAEPEKLRMLRYIHRHDLRTSVNLFRALLAEDISFLPQLLLKRQDGTDFFGEVSAAAVKDDDNQTTSIIMVIRDITQRKLTETELIQAKEKAEESDKLKSAFLANMSHEIRTPLNGILGFLNFLADDNLSSSRRRDYAAVVNNSSTQLVRLIDDIIDIAKIEAKQMSIHPAVLRLNGLMKDLQIFFETYLRSNNKDKIALILDDSGFIDPDAIFVDPIRLRQVLTNLIGNAVKFTEKGYIGISYRLLPPDKLEFLVEDTGIGLPANQLEVIFERFRQVELSNSRKYGGTGLGLTISRSLARMMGGNLTVESAEGQGSAFRFSITHIPVHPQDLPLLEATSGEPVVDTLAGLSVLMVEPDAMTARYCEKLLTASGATVIRAQTVQQWMDTVNRQRHINAVLADARVFLTEDDQTYRTVRSIRAGLPLIFTIPEHNEYYDRLIAESNCNGVIEGVGTSAKLHELLRRYL